jgi:thiol-disulfide isomerase/thioredoxin
MPKFLDVAIWALMSAATLGAQELPQDTNQAARYRALVREFQAAQQNSSKASSESRTESDRRGALALKPDPTAFARRFLDLAREKPADRASFDALTWVVSHCPLGAEGDQAFQLLAASHLDDPRLSPVLQRLGSSKSSEAEKLLRAAMEKSTDREVQAHACYTLALMLTAREHHAVPSKRRTIKSKKTAAAKQPEPNEPFRQEIETLYGRLLKDYRDVQFSRKKTYGEIALAALEKLNPGGTRNASGETTPPAGVGLEIGMAAPETRGLDTRGGPMRLSDFRGKVVVLDFWGDWCPHCRDMYPHERSLVKRLEGKPFALVGINSDKNLEELHTAMEREQITWPSWFDGGGTGGPIATLYGVNSWPTVYVLDPKGVIRFKDVRGADLDKAVDALLEESGLTDVTVPGQKPRPAARTPRQRDPKKPANSKQTKGTEENPDDSR